MRRGGNSVESMVREAFGLVIELRGRHEAARLLSQAIAFLKMLTREGDAVALPVVVSVRAMHLPKS
jgi:hypothetical protein